MLSSITFVLLSSLFATSVRGQAIYIPGFDPQPLSISVLGSSNGETTYAIKLVPTGTEVIPSAAFAYPTVTLIENASKAVVGAQFPNPDNTAQTLAQTASCSYSIAQGQTTGVASCVAIDVVGGSTSQDTYTEKALVFTTVNGGAGAGSGSGSGSAQATSTGGVPSTSVAPSASASTGRSTGAGSPKIEGASWVWSIGFAGAVAMGLAFLG